jgi:uncharacterized membrane protein
MTAGNDFDPELDQPKLFSARLTPHRSLNRTGFVVLMAFLSIVSFATGIAFWLMGAWPVFGFFGLDVLVLNPLWVQLDQKTHAEFGIERLYLVSRGRRVSIGSFLGPDEKASFARALLTALQTAKRGITYNPV